MPVNGYSPMVMVAWVGSVHRSRKRRSVVVVWSWAMAWRGVVWFGGWVLLYRVIWNQR